MSFENLTEEQRSRLLHDFNGLAWTDQEEVNIDVPENEWHPVPYQKPTKEEMEEFVKTLTCSTLTSSKQEAEFFSKWGNVRESFCASLNESDSLEPLSRETSSPELASSETSTRKIECVRKYSQPGC